MGGHLRDADPSRWQVFQAILTSTSCTLRLICILTHIGW